MPERPAELKFRLFRRGCCYATGGVSEIKGPRGSEVKICKKWALANWYWFFKGRNKTGSKGIKQLQYGFSFCYGNRLPLPWWRSIASDTCRNKKQNKNRKKTIRHKSLLLSQFCQSPSVSRNWQSSWQNRKFAESKSQQHKVVYRRVD